MISHDELTAQVSYNPETGIFRNKKGREVGTQSATSVIITIKGRAYTGMRLAWFYVHGEWPKGNARAVNGNGLDCRISNIEVPATREKAKPTGWDSKSPMIYTNGRRHVRGITFDPKQARWVARPTINGKRRFLGRFAAKEDAEAAVLSAFA